MAASKQVQVRLSDEQVAAIERKAATMKTYPSQEVTTSDVIRAAIDQFTADVARKKSRKTG